MKDNLLISEDPGTAPTQSPGMGFQKPFLIDSKAKREAGLAYRELFSQSVVQSSSLDLRRRRGCALTSIVFEGIVIGFLLLLPFLTLDVLPTEHLASFLIAPPPPPPPPPPAPPGPKMRQIVSEVVSGQLQAPSRIPKTVKMIEEEELPPAASFGVVGGVEGGAPGGQANGLLGSLLSSTHSAAAPVIATPKRIAISTGIADGLLLTRVEPGYPVIARTARVEGTVRLKAIISKNGSIENLQLIDGPPLLAPSAMEAVKQWRYRPYTLNGNPVEVETLIIIQFHLS